FACAWLGCCCGLGCNSRCAGRCVLGGPALHSGHTVETNTMFLPSGDHSSPSASVEMFVTWRVGPSSAVSELNSAVHTCELPPFAEIKAKCRPSGAQRGRS